MPKALLRARPLLYVKNGGDAERAQKPTISSSLLCSRHSSNIGFIFSSFFFEQTRKKSNLYGVYLVVHIMFIQRANHTQLAKMSFDKIFDLTAGVYFYFS